MWVLYGTRCGHCIVLEERLWECEEEVHRFCCRAYPFIFLDWNKRTGKFVCGRSPSFGWTTLYLCLYVMFNVFLPLIYWFNCIIVIALWSCFSNNWYQSQKVYLAGKLTGKKGSWFDWEEWQKREILELINLTTKTISYGRCKWRTIYTRIICTFHWEENQNNRWLWRMKMGGSWYKGIGSNTVVLGFVNGFKYFERKNNRGCDENIG